MPVEYRWYEFTRENIEKIPKGEIGVYLLADKDKKPLRVGSSASEGVGIRGRLISHLIYKTCRTAKYFKFVYADSPQEARNMENDAFNKYKRKNPPAMSKHMKRVPQKHDDFWLLS